MGYKDFFCIFADQGQGVLCLIYQHKTSNYGNNLQG